MSRTATSVWRRGVVTGSLWVVTVQRRTDDEQRLHDVVITSDVPARPAADESLTTAAAAAAAAVAAQQQQQQRSSSQQISSVHFIFVSLVRLSKFYFRK